MTQEEKELLLKDLSARLPYGVFCVGITYELDDDGERYIPVKVKDILSEIHNYKLETASVRLGLISSCKLETVKPYLRPMSSMTEDEKVQLSQYACIGEDLNGEFIDEVQRKDCVAYIDWLNVNHFDYRGLIEKGLALEAPEGMYNLKVK